MNRDDLQALTEPAAALAGAYLKARGRTAQPLPNGVLATPLSGPDLNAPWQMWLATSGANPPWLISQVRAAHRVPREQWPSALEGANAWNGTSPLTKAWLAVEDWQHSADGGFVLEASLPAHADLEQTDVDAFLDAVTRDALQFWRGLLRT